MSKSISFPKPGVPKRTSPGTAADDWVDRRGHSAGSPAIKRFTIDVPADLHRRIKMACAMRDENMAEMMRKLLNREFPEDERKS